MHSRIEMSSARNETGSVTLSERSFHELTAELDAAAAGTGQLGQGQGDFYLNELKIRGGVSSFDAPRSPQRNASAFGDSNVNAELNEERFSFVEELERTTSVRDSAMAV